MNLSLKQQEIVNHINGPLLVEAGPGSGKTRVLIERIKKILASTRRGKILALTFSNLAADEMKTRLSEDVSLEDKLDRVTVGTIHSFCLDIVQSRGNLIGLSPDMVLFENDDDRRAVLRQAFLENPELAQFLSEQSDKNKLVQRCLQLISESKRKFILPENSTINEPFPKIYEAYNQKLLEQAALDFDDILFFAYRILTENPSVVRMYNSLYHYICVDEAQDLNFAQYKVIKALCGDSFENIMMVGDVNQSIYGFNGSDSNYMSGTFIDDFHPTVYRLNENYRSAKRIVSFANELQHYDSVTNYVYEGEVCAICLPNEASEAKYVVDKIEQLVECGHPDIEGSFTLDRCAIIARNRYVFSAVEMELEKRGIPFYFKKSAAGIINESDFMDVFELAMRILINPKDYVHLQKLKKIIGVSDSIKNSPQDSITLLSNIMLNSKFQVLLPALQELAKDNFNFKKVLKILESVSDTFEDHERYLMTMDIKEWKEHWNKYCLLVARENRNLTSFRNQISLGKTKEVEKQNGISLLTAHMSKGLQYDVVFIIGLCEGTFPDYRAVRMGGKELEQETNNMYVAVTRAKRLCYMSYPRYKVMPWGDTKYQYPSRYIKGICIDSMS